VIYLLYRYGLWTGLSMILLATSWDLLTKGITCLFYYDKYSICWKGTLTILVGVALILLHIFARGKIVLGQYYSYKHIPEGKLK